MGDAAAGLLQVVGIMVLAAAALALLARAARMPSIVSYLFAGLVVGPVAGWVGPADPHGPLQTVAEVGVVLLMFLVGLELSLERIRQVGRVAVAAGLGQVLFTAAGGIVIAWALGFGWLESTFIAVALTFSSTVVVVKLLDQKSELQSLYGRIAVGIFLVQDLVVVVILTVLAGLGRPETLTPLSVAGSLALAFGGMALLLGVALLAARRLLPPVLGWAAPEPRLMFVASLAWCFVYVLAAQVLGLSIEIGAFLAGLSLAQLEVAQDLRRRMHPVMTFFIVVFFVSLGARIDPAAAADYWVEATVLSLFVLLGNPLIFMWIIARHGYSERTSFLTSVTVGQISELSFVFAAMGTSLGLFSESILAVVAVVGVVTMAVSAYMILYNAPLYRWMARTGVLRMFRAAPEDEKEPASERPAGHVVVVGMNDLGRRIARTLHERGERVTAVDTDLRKLEDLPCRTLAGDIDYESTLEDVGLARAKLAVSALRIEATNKLFAYRCRAAGVPVVVYAFDREMVAQLRKVHADLVLDARLESGHALVAELGRLGAVPR